MADLTRFEQILSTLASEDAEVVKAFSRPLTASERKQALWREVRAYAQQHLPGLGGSYRATAFVMATALSRAAHAFSRGTADKDDVRIRSLVRILELNCGATIGPDRLSEILRGYRCALDQPS